MTTTKRRTKPARSSARPSPSQIAPGVFVGGWGEAEHFEGTRFCVLDERPDGMPEGTHIPIYDDRTGQAIRANLDRLAREMSAAHARGEPVVVFCGHGVRRSPLGAAWYLHRSEGIDLDAAYARIRAVRPKVETAAMWLEDTKNLETG